MGRQTLGLVLFTLTILAGYSLIGLWGGALGALLGFILFLA
jgi:hypothetical protein